MAEKISQCPVCKATDFSGFLEINDYFLTKENFAIQKCDGCGFKFINPRPSKSEIDRYYQSDEYISHDAKRVNLISRIYKLARVFSIQKKFKVVSSYTKTGKILDIGCGTGEFLRYCKSKGFDVMGVEPNDKARVYAQQRNKIQTTAVLPELKEYQGSFSCITLWHVLEHVHDLNDTIEKIKSLLKPEGVLIIAVPNCNSWDANKYGKFWAAYDVPRHLYHFTETTLKRLFSEHAFVVRNVLPQKLDAYYVSMLSEKYLTGGSNYFKALFFGFWSNFQARKTGVGHSSQIFILSVKKA